MILVLAGLLVLGLAVLAARSDDFRKMEFSRLPSRAGWQLPDRVIEVLGIEAGDRIADLGAGNGYFVDYFSAALGPGGKLYAVDVDAEAVASLAAKIRQQGVPNVEVIEASTTDARLPDGEIDLVFLCNVYHHIDDQVAYFDRLRTDLSPGGRVAVVEGRSRGWAKWVSPAGHATARDELVAEMEQAGYRLEESYDFLPIQNLLIFRPTA